MNITRNLLIAVLMTIATTILLGLVYPLAMTAIAQAIFPDKANGQLVMREGRVIGSRIIGESFSSPGYFHGRPSAAGTGYDAANSAGTNLGPTSRQLVDALKTALAAARCAPRPAAAHPLRSHVAPRPRAAPETAPRRARDGDRVPTPTT